MRTIVRLPAWCSCYLISFSLTRFMSSSPKTAARNFVQQIIDKNLAPGGKYHKKKTIRARLPPKSNVHTTSVKLNVGGTLFEVAKSTIEKHPDTMLARLISEE